MTTLWGVLFFLGLAVVGKLIADVQFRKKKRQRIRRAWGRPMSWEEPEPEILEDISGYYQERRQLAAEGTPVVDNITWNDLDMDTVFQALNRTHSSVGEEKLYAMLREIGVKDEFLFRRGRWMAALETEEEARISLQVRLSRLGKSRFHSAYGFLFRPEHKCPAHGWIYMILAVMPVLCLALTAFSTLWLVGVVAFSIINGIVFYYTHSIWKAHEVAIRHLAAVLYCAGGLRKHRVRGMEDLTEELYTLCGVLKPISRWNGLFAMQGTGELAFITEYIRILFQLDMISLSRLTAFITQHQEQVARLYDLVGEVDACMAIASVRASLAGYVLPEFGMEKWVSVSEVVHPLLKNPVSNSLEWQDCLLLTGSNASGKSTFVKAVALNAIFAQSIFTCWAKAFALPRTQVMTSMALRDNIHGGESYFMIEIKSLRRILRALRQDVFTLCFVDEILRGTNTVERIASSASLLDELAEQNVLCMAATHDVELTRLLPKYRQYHFREEMTGEGMTFPYRLMKGPCNTRNAIRLLEQLEFPVELVHRAGDMAAYFDQSGKWALPQREEPSRFDTVDKEGPRA